MIEFDNPPQGALYGTFWPAKEESGKRQGVLVIKDAEGNDVPNTIVLNPNAFLELKDNPPRAVVTGIINTALGSTISVEGDSYSSVQELKSGQYTIEGQRVKMLPIHSGPIKDFRLKFRVS